MPEVLKTYDIWADDDLPRTLFSEAVTRDFGDNLVFLFRGKVMCACVLPLKCNPTACGLTKIAEYSRREYAPMTADQLGFDDALKIAKGCMDYGGGYRSNQDELEIYHHGIQTVINALTGAKERGLTDLQTGTLHAIGSRTDSNT